VRETDQRTEIGNSTSRLQIGPVRNYDCRSRMWTQDGRSGAVWIDARLLCDAPNFSSKPNVWNLFPEHQFQVLTIIGQSLTADSELISA